MRIVALACAVLALGGTAYAQNEATGRPTSATPAGQPPVNPPSGSTTSDPVSRTTATPPGTTSPAPRTDPARTGQSSPTSALVPEMPSTWKGDAASWQGHVTACKDQYPSYDAKTDKYDGPNGAKTTCALAEPK